MMALLLAVQTSRVYTEQVAIQVPPAEKQALVVLPTIPSVPFYSQFSDITSPVWQKVGCGIASLTMVIDYYVPNAVSVNTLLVRGIASGAYQKNAGWIHKGLVDLSRKYKLDGNTYDLSKLDSKKAFAMFSDYLKDGPVIVSVHYKFEPKNPIPHLVVITGIKDGVVYYNDPAAKTGAKQISTADFLKAWKQKFIVIRPVITPSKDGAS